MRLLRFRRHSVKDEELSAYLDGRLSGRAKERVDAHLQTCLDCSRKLEDLRLLVAEMRRLPETKAPRSFALSPQAAAAARREGDRARREERIASRRAYLGLSGATVVAAVLLVALIGSDVGVFSRQSGHADESTGGEAAVRVPAAATSSDQNLQAAPLTKSTQPETEGAPGEAPSPPNLMGPAASDSVRATPPAASTPLGVTAAEVPATANETETSSHLWLWILEGAAGGLIVGLGLSAFWMRRRWVEIDRK